MCAESKPRTVRLTRSNAECPDHIPESSFVCYVYDLSVAGFKPDRKATRRIIGATYGGISQPCAARCVRSFPVDSDGRGRLDGALYAFGGQRVTIDVDGVRTAVDVG
jgi:hypothetical protein